MPTHTDTPARRRCLRMLESIAGLPSTTPTPGELAEALGRPEPEMAGELTRLERFGFVESWPDPGRVGARRFMISAKGAATIGVRLSARGDRWMVPPGQTLTPDPPPPTAPDAPEPPRRRDRAPEPRDPAEARETPERPQAGALSQLLWEWAEGWNRPGRRIRRAPRAHRPPVPPEG